MPDAGFEDWNPDASDTLDAMYLYQLNSWWTNNGSPDFHHQEHPTGFNLTSLEDCPLGNGAQECGVPLNGQGVLGLYKANGENGSKEWATTKLSEPIQEGMIYKVSFWIQNKYDNLDYYSNTSNWGVFFNNDSILDFGPDTINFDQFEN